MSKSWNWHPDLPLTRVPYWVWPPRPLAVLKWLRGYWLQFSDRNVYVVLALAFGLWLMPVTAAQTELELGWVSQVLLRNYVAMLVVAGGLHLWFYTFNAQAHELKYDPRPMERRKPLFFLGHQTWDNMFYTLLYAVPIATSYEVLMRTMYASGHAPIITFAQHPVWFIALFPILMMFQGMHFYLIHRPLHWPPLYRWVHSIHHRNANPGPWSGLSMHPFEHVLYFSTLLVFLVLPAHPVHMLFLLFWQLLGAPSGHSGYEAVATKGKPRLSVGGFFHQLHHRYFECNYGNEEFPFDRWFGTHHDGTDAATDMIRERRRRLHSS